MACLDVYRESWRSRIPRPRQRRQTTRRRRLPATPVLCTTSVPSAARTKIPSQRYNMPSVSPVVHFFVCPDVDVMPSISPIVNCFVFPDLDDMHSQSPLKTPFCVPIGMPYVHSIFFEVLLRIELGLSSVNMTWYVCIVFVGMLIYVLISRIQTEYGNSRDHSITNTTRYYVESWLQAVWSHNLDHIVALMFYWASRR